MTTEFTRHRIGLVGAGISTSLSPALHSHEASALGLDDYSYELVDLENLTVSVEKTGEVVRERRRSRLHRTEHHPSVQAGCRGRSRRAVRQRAVARCRQHGCGRPRPFDRPQHRPQRIPHSTAARFARRRLGPSGTRRRWRGGFRRGVRTSPPPVPRIFASQILIPIALPMCVLASPRPFLPRAQRLWRSVRSLST